MGYTTTADLEIAAGGAAALTEIADQDNDGVADPAVLSAAMAEADSWIDGHAARLHVTPFVPPPDHIRAMAAAEAVYILRAYRRVLGDDDQERRLQRETTIERMGAGMFFPVQGDTYPQGDGGGAPVAGVRTASASSTSLCDDQLTRDSMRGAW